MCGGKEGWRFPDLANAYETTGARVQCIETMTLEEIFVANVEHSREEVEA